MADKMDIFERRMVNINGDLRERVIYQRHMADDIFQAASGVIDEALITVASGVLAEDFVLAAADKNIPNPHFIYSLDTNVCPDASGTRSVGTAAIGWAEGYFDKLVATELIYVDSHNIRLGDLVDVEITAPASGHILYFDQITGLWKNKHISQV
jgi:phage-related protein